MTPLVVLPVRLTARLREEGKDHGARRFSGHERMHDDPVKSGHVGEESEADAGHAGCRERLDKGCLKRGHDQAPFR